jgi:hypothetical protein
MESIKGSFWSGLYDLGVAWIEPVSSRSRVFVDGLASRLTDLPNWLRSCAKAVALIM